MKLSISTKISDVPNTGSPRWIRWWFQTISTDFLTFSTSSVQDNFGGDFSCCQRWFQTMLTEFAGVPNRVGSRTWNQWNFQMLQLKFSDDADGADTGWFLWSLLTFVNSNSDGLCGGEGGFQTSLNFQMLPTKVPDDFDRDSRRFWRNLRRSQRRRF